MEAGEGKNAKCWAPHLRAPTLGALTFSRLGPPPLWAPTLGASTLQAPPSWQRPPGAHFFWVWARTFLVWERGGLVITPLPHPNLKLVWGLGEREEVNFTPKPEPPSPPNRCRRQPDSVSITQHFVILQLLNHKKIPVWARLYGCVFCKKPSLFSSSNRNHNSGLSGNE